MLINKKYTQSFVYVNQVLFKVLQMFLRINSPSVLLNLECAALSVILSSSSLTSFSLHLSLINVSSISFGKSSLIRHMFAFYSHPWPAILRSAKVASKHLFKVKKFKYQKLHFHPDICCNILQTELHIFFFCMPQIWHTNSLSDIFKSFTKVANLLWNLELPWSVLKHAAFRFL